MKHKTSEEHTECLVELLILIEIADPKSRSRSWFLIRAVLLLRSASLHLTAVSSAPRIRLKLCETARACTCFECSKCCLSQFDRNESSVYEYSKFHSKIV